MNITVFMYIMFSNMSNFSSIQIQSQTPGFYSQVWKQ